MSYVYTSMYNFFARDDVGLPGFAAYFRHNRYVGVYVPYVYVCACACDV